MIGSLRERLQKMLSHPPGPTPTRVTFWGRDSVIQIKYNFKQCSKNVYLNLRKTETPTWTRHINDMQDTIYIRYVQDSASDRCETSIWIMYYMIYDPYWSKFHIDQMHCLVVHAWSGHIDPSFTSIRCTVLYVTYIELFRDWRTSKEFYIDWSALKVFYGLSSCQVGWHWLDVQSTCTLLAKHKY